MIFEFPLCSMLMRIRARRALVRHGHSRQVYLSVSDAGILYHLTLLGIIFLTLERMGILLESLLGCLKIPRIKDITFNIFSDNLFKTALFCCVASIHLSLLYYRLHPLSLH